MRFVIVRSGLGEAIHDVDVYAVDAAGNELLSSGEPDHPMNYRSFAEPTVFGGSRPVGTVTHA